MSESTTGDVPVEDPSNASVPETPQRPAPKDRPGAADETGAVPAPGQVPKDDPDAEAEERFDAG